MLQLQQRKKNLQRRKPELQLKNKSSGEKAILYQPSLVLSPTQMKHGWWAVGLPNT